MESKFNKGQLKALENLGFLPTKSDEVATYDEAAYCDEVIVYNKKDDINKFVYFKDFSPDHYSDEFRGNNNKTRSFENFNELIDFLIFYT